MPCFYAKIIGKFFLNEQNNPFGEILLYIPNVQHSKI